MSAVRDAADSASVVLRPWQQQQQLDITPVSVASDCETEPLYCPPPPTPHSRHDCDYDYDCDDDDDDDRVTSFVG